MKRLKMPKIPTRIPVPDISSIRIRSHKKIESESVAPAPSPLAEEPTPPAQALEQPAAEKPFETKESVPHKTNMRIPLPNISMPSFHKPNAPKLSMPSLRKTKEKPETASRIEPAPQLETPPAMPVMKPAPIVMPQTPVETGPAQTSIQPTPLETPKTPTIAPQTSKEAPAAPPETAKVKGKSKLGMPKMPKLGMPSMSMGKGKGGGTKVTGKRILALSIEGNDIRVLNYRNNAVESWKSVSFNSSLLKMGQVADPVGLGEIIKSAVADFETSKCYILCALPGLRSVSRIISVPNVSKKEMETIIPREVRRTMTVSEEDNYFHWQVLPVEAAQARVFVLAVPKEPMSLLLQAFSNAGLRPSQIDLKPLALMKAINQKDAVIANCEGNSMELVIVSDDIPVLIRSVFLGEGVANQDYAVGRISDELGRTIVTYNEINKEKPLDQDVPIYLTGAAAAGVPFALNVAALTGRTVQPLESPVTIPGDLPLAEYMVNIGLLLKVV